MVDNGETPIIGKFKCYGWYSGQVRMRWYPFITEQHGHEIGL